MRRYVPRWIGGNDGRLDQVAANLIHEAEVGSDVNATWEYDERIRFVSLIKLGGEQPNPQPEPETGAVEGILVGKGANNDSLDVRPDGNATAGEILVPNDLVEAVSHLYSSNRVKVEWAKGRGSHSSYRHRRAEPASGGESREQSRAKSWTKSENSWIEIKPAEGPLRRYVPRWIGGNAGGLDQVAANLIHEAEIGSDVNATWEYDERIRLVSLIKLDGEQLNPQPEPETGAVEGILVDKGANNDSLYIRPDGNAPAGKILVPNDLVEAVSHLYTPNRVKVEWSKTEGATHPTATAVQNLRPAENQGTVTGKVVAKDDDNWIEIKQVDGPLRRYVPRWIGGNTGGLDQVAKDLIREAEVGSDVNATWEYDERIRLVSLIKLGGEQPNPQPEPETGAVEGILVGKGANNDSLDVRPDGNATAGEILVPNDLVEAVSHLYSSNRVKVEWEKAEGATHPTATAVQNLRPAENQGTVTGKVVAQTRRQFLDRDQAGGRSLATLRSPLARG